MQRLVSRALNSSLRAAERRYVSLRGFGRLRNMQSFFGIVVKRFSADVLESVGLSVLLNRPSTELYGVRNYGTFRYNTVYLKARK